MNEAEALFCSLDGLSGDLQAWVYMYLLRKYVDGSKPVLSRLVVSNIFLFHQKQQQTYVAPYLERGSPMTEKERKRERDLYTSRFVYIYIYRERQSFFV